MHTENINITDCCYATERRSLQCKYYAILYAFISFISICIMVMTMNQINKKIICSNTQYITSDRVRAGKRENWNYHVHKAISCICIDAMTPNKLYASLKCSKTVIYNICFLLIDRFMLLVTIFFMQSRNIHIHNSFHNFHDQNR